MSLEVKAEHKILFDVFARVQDFNLSFEEVSLYCHPYKLKEFKFIPLKNVKDLSLYDYTLKLSQIEDILCSGTKSLFFQNSTLDVDMIADKSKFKSVKCIVFDSCTMIHQRNFATLIDL